MGLPESRKKQAKQAWKLDVESELSLSNCAKKDKEWRHPNSHLSSWEGEDLVLMLVSQEMNVYACYL